MSSKHHTLTRTELESFSLNPFILRGVESLLAERRMDPDKIRILDWGCGRGRSVAKLRLAGFEAYGLDIDERVLENGKPLISQLGFTGTEILQHIDKSEHFPDGFFDMVFSEQVLEHVQNLDCVLEEIRRISSVGSIGIHLFPGAWNVIEGHIHIPFVHWLPKHSIRRLLIFTGLLLGYGPTGGWPENEGKTLWEKSAVFEQYLRRKTFYRPTKRIISKLKEYGFEVKREIFFTRGKRTRFLPKVLSRNGFPEGSIALITSVPCNPKSAETHLCRS